jgi:hypothetical protein
MHGGFTLTFLLLPPRGGSIIDDLPERRRQRFDVLHLTGIGSGGPRANRDEHDGLDDVGLVAPLL